MGLFPIPQSVEDRLDKLRGDFLWQGNKDKRTMNLVKWEVLTLSKKQGGLGIRNLRFHNQSLLQKWLWRFSFEDTTLWRRFIAHKYGLLNQWTTNVITSTYGTSTWRTIRNYWPSFNSNICIEIGNGQKTVYGMMHGQGSTVKINQVCDHQGWNLLFRRALNDWEMTK